MDNIKLSVIIPVYNQFNELLITLSHFALQSYKRFELIVVDDGSTDRLSQLSSQVLKKMCNFESELKIIHQTNRGRASARNQGIYNSEGELIVFCDADRIPNRDMLLQFSHANKNHKIVVGGSMDYFGPKSNLKSVNDYELKRFSRFPKYYQKMSTMFIDGESTCDLSWLGFLVGTSCVTKNLLVEVGGFSEFFLDWGFEHFDLGYRLKMHGESIYLDEKIQSYHLVHSRPEQFYQNRLSDSINLLCELHPEIDEKRLRQIFIHKEYRFT